MTRFCCSMFRAVPLTLGDTSSAMSTFMKRKQPCMNPIDFKNEDTAVAPSLVLKRKSQYAYTSFSAGAIGLD